MSATLLAASVDDSRLAYIHGGRLVLCDARALTELVAADAPEGARQLAFVGPPWRLLVATEDELFTYELATLTVLGRRTVASGARVAAVVENRAVLWLPAGPSIALARFLDDAIDVHALDTSGPPLDVAPLEQQQALVVTAQRNEIVDLISRRVMARLHLALPPPPRLLGQSSGLRFLWTAAVGARELTIIRLSDGRSSTVELPAPIRQVLAANTASWVVVDTDDGLLRVHVMTLAVHRIEADLSRAACVGGAADPGLYWIDAGWRLQRTSLAGDAVVATGGGPLRLSFTGLDDGRPAPTTASTGITPPGTTRSPLGVSPSRAASASAATAASATEASAPPASAPATAPEPLARLEPSGPAPLGFTQLEPSAPVPLMPSADAPPLFADPAPAAAPPPTTTPAATQPELAPVEVAPPPAIWAGARTPSAVWAGDGAASSAAWAGERTPSAVWAGDSAPTTTMTGASVPAAERPTVPPPAAERPTAPPPAAERPTVPPPADAGPPLPPLPEEAGPAAGLTADARPVRSWRMQCAAWARDLLRGRDQLEPSFAGTPLALLARRAHLDPDGARALALLYGAWLLGHPAQPLARLARAIIWDELAGRGSLPEAGLHTVRSGKAAIRPTVARFLDGARPRRLTVHGLRPRTNLTPGRQLVFCLTDVPLTTAAQAVADHLGAAAIIDERGARGRRQLAVALDEAWLRSVPAVVIPGADLDAGTIASARLRRDHSLIVLWPDRVVPTPLEDLPILAL